MNFGGIIAGAIGGGATAVGELADQNIKSQAEEDRFRRQAAWDVQKANAAMDRKLQLDEQMTQRTEKRYTDAADMAETRGQQIGMEKDATSMQGARAALPNEGDYANTPVSRADIASLPPAARKIYEEQGLIPKTTESGIIANQMQAAREGGAPKALRDDLRKNYQDTAKSEAEGRKGALEMQKLDRKERMELEREDRKDARQDKNIEALQARTEAALSGREGRDGVKRTLDMIDSQRKSTTEEARDLRRAMESELKDAKFDEAEKKAIRDRYAAPLKDIDAKRKKLDADFDGVRNVLGAGGSGSGTPAASGASAGRGIVNNEASGDTTPSDIRSNIAANTRSIEMLRKQPLNQGETQASRDESIRMIEAENARMQRGAGPNPGASAPVGRPVAAPVAAPVISNPLKAAPPDGTRIRDASGKQYIVRNGKPVEVQ